jgi:hypothetical protein
MMQMHMVLATRVQLEGLDACQLAKVVVGK